MKVVKDYPNVNFFPQYLDFWRKEKKKGRRGRGGKERGGLCIFDLEMLISL